VTGRLAAAAVGLLLVAAACSDGSSEGAAPRSSPEDEAPASTTTTLDDSPFCQSVRALVALGDDAADPTPEAVVSQSQEMQGLLDEVAAAAPGDAPPDVPALLADFRAIADAVVASGGDVDAAYAALQAGQPELWDRLAQPTAHEDGFRFFADRCGTPMP
jgi:hypothetical protein